MSSLGDELVLIGRVGKPHGLKGAFFVEGASEDPDRFARGASVLVDGVPLKVVDAKRGAGGRPVIQLDGPAARGAPLERRLNDPRRGFCQPEGRCGALSARLLTPLTHC